MKPVALFLALLTSVSTVLPQGLDCEHTNLPDGDISPSFPDRYTNYRNVGEVTDVPPMFDGNRYALLINGGKTPDENQPGFYDNLAFIYRVLVNKYGWDKADITVCCSDGDDPAPDQSNGTNSNTDLDGDGIADYSNDARKDTVTTEFNNLVNEAEPGDMVFIFLIDHGGYDTPDTPDVRMALWFPDGGDDPYIHDDELAGYVAMMPPESVKVVFVSACFSGGFVDDFEDDPGIENVIIATSASYDSVSHNYFVQWLITFLNMGYESDDKENAPAVYVDTNRDGYASCKEAFDLASRYESNDEPQWYDSDQLGHAATLFGVLPIAFQVDQIEHHESPDPYNTSDGDGLYEAGEVVEVYLSLHNAGTALATDISLELVNEDPDQYIEVINGASIILEIPPGETGTNTQPLLVRVKDNLVDNSSCKLSLRINDGSYDYGIDYDVWLLLCEDSEITYFFEECNMSSPYEWFEEGTGEWYIERDLNEYYWRCGNDDGSGYNGPLLSTIYSPIVYLRGDYINSLVFQSRIEVREGDIGSVDVYNGQDWQNLLILGYSDVGYSWTDVAFTLTDLPGIMSQVRFTMESNYNGLGSGGWYLDNVGLGCRETPGIISNFSGTYIRTDELIMLVWECYGEYIAGFNLYRRKIVDSGKLMGDTKVNHYDYVTSEEKRVSIAMGERESKRSGITIAQEMDYEEDNWILINDSVIHYNTRHYADPGIIEGEEYEYKLEALHNLVPPVSSNTYVSTMVPRTYNLCQSYPNPATATANIAFGIPRDDAVTLIIYDIKGRLVAKPVDENLAAGIYTIPVDTSSLSPGVYFYRLTTPDFGKTMKMVVTK